MLQTRPRCGLQEALGHQALQLLGAIGNSVRRIFGVFDLAGSGGVFQQDGAGHARHLGGDQGQAAPALLHPALEREFVGG